MTTYVFCGVDDNGAMKKEREILAQEKDVVFIHPKPGESFEQAVKRSHMKPGDNVELLCHGSPDGSFAWQASPEPLVSYKQLFRTVPDGLAQINMASCYGGTAITQDVMQYAPSGCTILTSSSATSVGWSTFGAAKKRETVGNNNPVIDYIETLDNIDPALYRSGAETYNSINSAHHNADPLAGMPTRIGIGGNPSRGIPPRIVDMKVELNKLQHRDNSTVTSETPAFFRAKELVKQRFDADINGHGLANGMNDRQIDALVDRVAEAMNAGKSLNMKDPNVARIAYAITAAYMSETGRLDPNYQEPKQQHSQSSGQGQQQQAAPVHLSKEAIAQLKYNELGSSYKYTNNEKAKMDQLEVTVIQLIEKGKISQKDGKQLLDGVRESFYSSVGDDAYNKDVLEAFGINGNTMKPRSSGALNPSHQEPQQQHSQSSGQGQQQQAAPVHLSKEAIAQLKYNELGSSYKYTNNEKAKMDQLEVTVIQLIEKGKISQKDGKQLLDGVRESFYSSVGDDTYNKDVLEAFGINGNTMKPRDNGARTKDLKAFVEPEQPVIHVSKETLSQIAFDKFENSGKYTSNEKTKINQLEDTTVKHIEKGLLSKDDGVELLNSVRQAFSWSKGDDKLNSYHKGELESHGIDHKTMKPTKPNLGTSR